MHDCDVCIPCYEMNGKGAEYLGVLIETAVMQSDVDFRIVVSDQSTNEDVKDLCLSHPMVDYHRFDGPRNPCDNLNFAISRCKGRVVKIMFQDDFFIPDPHSLKKCIEPIIDGGFRWTACTCMHTKDGSTLYRLRTPVYHSNIHHGVNTMSSPSIISILNEDIPKFDNEVSLLLDVDWYKRAHDLYGDFHLVQDPCVVNRIHEDSLSSKVSNKSTLDAEVKYIKEKYNEQV